MQTIISAYAAAQKRKYAKSCRLTSFQTMATLCVWAAGAFLMAQTGPPSSTQPSTHATLDAASRERLLNAIGIALMEYYVESDVAKKMDQFLQDRQKRGDYSSLTDRDAFAEVLQRDFAAH